MRMMPVSGEYLRNFEEELLGKGRELLALRGVEHVVLSEDLPAGHKLILSVGIVEAPRGSGPFGLMMLPSMPVWPGKPERRDHRPEP